MAELDPLVALHGDSWESPWWAVALGSVKLAGETLTDYTARLESASLSDWEVRAQVRDQPQPDASEPLFDWSEQDDLMEFGTAQVTLPRRLPDRPDPIVLTLPALRVRLDKSDWDGKPTVWKGVLEVQLTSKLNPEKRHTLPRRKFRVQADYVP